MLGVTARQRLSELGQPQSMLLSCEAKSSIFCDDRSFLSVPLSFHLIGEPSGIFDCGTVCEMQILLCRVRVCTLCARFCEEYSSQNREVDLGPQQEAHSKSMSVGAEFVLIQDCRASGVNLPL